MIDFKQITPQIQLIMGISNSQLLAAKQIQQKTLTVPTVAISFGERNILTIFNKKYQKMLNKMAEIWNLVPHLNEKAFQVTNVNGKSTKLLSALNRDKFPPQFRLGFSVYKLTKQIVGNKGKRSAEYVEY